MDTDLTSQMKLAKLPLIHCFELQMLRVGALRLVVEKSTFSKCSVTDSESVGEINDSVAQK